MFLPDERKFTAFEANGQLYQFKRVPCGLKNAVPCFQRVVNQIISKFDCQRTFAYLDDITVCGHTREEHDTNLEKFFKAAKQCNLTLNENKCVYTTTCINTRFTAIFLPLRLPLSRFRLNIIIDLLSAFLCVFLPNNNH